MSKRMEALQQEFRTLRSDSARYTMAELIRELGYIDFNDFYKAPKEIEHVDAVEYALKNRISADD
jgi:hypothetical protein